MTRDRPGRKEIVSRVHVHRPAKIDTQALPPRLGVARNASRDLLIALPGVRRGSLLESAGVLDGVAGAWRIFFADRRSSSAGSLFSLSEDSSTVSSLRFVPSTSVAASLWRTLRMVPVVEGP